MPMSDIDDLGRFHEPLGFIPSDGRDDWLTVGMALHYESGGSDEGYRMWTDWSQTSNSFDEQTQRSTWRNFKAKSGGKTGGSIIELARRHGYINGRASVPPPKSDVMAATTSEYHKPLALWHDVECAAVARGSRVVATYRYEHANGSLFAEKVRLEPKSFRWRHSVNGTWMSGKATGPIPPYGLARLIEHADQPVFVVEGEKDADRLNAEGQVAISIETGHEAAAAPHLDGRVVFIIPDNDKAGGDRARDVLEAVQSVAATARIIALPGLGAKGDVSDWLAAGHPIDELIRLSEDAVQAEVNELLAGFTALEDISLNPDDDEYLVEDVLPSQGVGFLYGPSGLGKTFVALDVGLAIARGIPFANKFDTEQGAAVFIALEAPSGVTKRIATYKREHRVNGGSFHLLKYALEICDQDSVAGLIRRLKALETHIAAKVRLVIFDTLSKAMPGRDENATKDMSLAIRHMEAIQRATGGCIVAIHHPGKDQDRGMRGHSNVAAGADFILRVKGEKNGLSELWIEKLKDGEDNKHIATYRLETRHLGTTTKKGRDITSAVIAWVEGERAKRHVKLTAKQQAILDNLDQLIIEGRFEITNEADGIPGGKQAVAVNDLIERCIKGGIVTSSEQPRSAKQSIRNQIAGLQQKGALHQFDGKVWRLSGI